MVGSAFTQRGLLLVEQPGAWGRQGLADSAFDPVVAAELQRRADAADLRLLAIRRESAPPGRAWAVRPAGSTTTTWGEYAVAADLLDLPLDASVTSAGEVAGEPSYLVCTHAKRDVCCALFARPIAAALEALRPGHVWGCSHTGGHRFAPVVVAVPDGGASAMYGHVADADLGDLVAATEAGRVLAPLLRGLNGHPPAAQAALAHVLVQHPVPADWRVVSDEDQGAGLWRIGLSGPRELDVLVEAASHPEPMVSCGKPEPSEQTHYRVLSTGPR